MGQPSHFQAHVVCNSAETTDDNGVLEPPLWQPSSNCNHNWSAVPLDFGVEGQCFKSVRKGFCAEATFLFAPRASSPSVGCDESADVAHVPVPEGVDAVVGRSFDDRVALFRIIDDILPMRLESDCVTPSEVTGIWSRWGVAY